MTALTVRFEADGGEYRVARALRDIREGIAAYPVWGLLGWQDIKQRYRRSVIGPFWLTISTGIMVAMLGFLYSGLFNAPLALYLPFVAVSMVAWSLISLVLNEACTVFIASETIIRQVRVPLTVHVCRMVWRNLLIFFHNALILLLVYVFFWKGLHWQILLVPLAVFCYALNGLWSGMLLGILCARFRDIAPIIGNLIQVLFFATPIMWLPELLEARGLAWVAQYNPLHHFIEILRAPLLGREVPALSWAVTAAVTAGGLLTALAFLQRYRHRVPYWL